MSGYESVINILQEVEEVAQQILNDKEQIVDLNRQRNKNREALRSLSKEFKEGTLSDKSWVCIGNMFFKFPKGKTKALLEKDQNKLDEEIKTLQKDMKSKVSKLREMEGKPALQGFNLNPLSNEEMQAIKRVLNP